jgi:hypothetical protein
MPNLDYRRSVIHLIILLLYENRFSRKPATGLGLLTPKSEERIPVVVEVVENDD